MNLHETLLELDVAIEFSYDPGEPEVRYYANGDGHPGTPPEVTIEHAWLEKDGDRIDIADFLPDKLIESLEEEILNESCELS